MTLAVRLVVGNFVINDWEGWTNFVENAIATVIEAVVLSLLFFFLAWLFAKCGHPETGAAFLGVLGGGFVRRTTVFSLQVLIAAGAAALAMVSRDRPNVGSPLLRSAVAWACVIVCWLASCSSPSSRVTGR